MRGVLERNPALRVIFTELGFEWIPGVLEEIGSLYQQIDTAGMRATRLQSGTSATSLSLTAAEYWDRQCYVTHSAGFRREQFEGGIFARLPNLVWGADVGHSEGMWPSLSLPDDSVSFRQDLRALIEDLPANRLTQFLSDNFFRAFTSVDRRQMSEIASRIGSPTGRELGLAS